MDVNGSRVDNGRVRNQRSSWKRIARIEDFGMFDRDGGFAVGRNVADKRGRAMAEREKFGVSANEAIICIDSLDLYWSETPYFRCSGVRRRSQKLISVSNFR